MLNSLDELYNRVFSNSKELLEFHIKSLKNIEEKIRNLRVDLLKKFQDLNINKFSIKDFEENEKLIKEFKIELQISALNGKIKSLDMPEFSNIISVIGESLNEESFKILSRFSELKNLFRLIIENFHNIETELIFLKSTYINISRFLKNILKNMENNADDIDRINECIDEALAKIFFIKNSDLSINIKKFKDIINRRYRRLNYLINDFKNFSYKINYLNIITKIEAGRLKENKFIMVTTTLDKIYEESNKIFVNIEKIFNYYNNCYKNFTDFYLNISKKLRDLLLTEYFYLLENVKDDLESFKRFLKKFKEVKNGNIK